MSAATTANLTTPRHSAGFPLGRVVSTAGVARKIAEGFNALPYLKRHLAGDWGDLCEEDASMNDAAIDSGRDRIFSSYEDTPIGKIWIITEWDRSQTTILFPEDY